MVILVFSNKLQINQKNLEGFKVFTNSPAYNIWLAVFITLLFRHACERQQDKARCYVDGR